MLLDVECISLELLEILMDAEDEDFDSLEMLEKYGLPALGQESVICKNCFNERFEKVLSLDKENNAIIFNFWGRKGLNYYLKILYI